MQDVDDRGRAQAWQPGRHCAMCLADDAGSRYVLDRWIPDVWYCESCWERSELQQRMVDQGLEQNPEVEN